MQGHPLEVFPWFRRWPKSVGRDLVYTFIFNLLFAAVFTLFGLIFAGRANLARLVEVNFVVAQCIGFSIHGLVRPGRSGVRRVAQGGIAMRTVYYMAVPIAGAFSATGWRPPCWRCAVAGADLQRGRSGVDLRGGHRHHAGHAGDLHPPRTCGPRPGAGRARRGARDRGGAGGPRSRACSCWRPKSSRISSTTRSRMCEASSTPNRPSPSAMLDRLIVLLRATASATQRTSTLGAQAELLRAYLELIALRMGGRLAWTIDVPGDLARVPVRRCCSSRSSKMRSSMGSSPRSTADASMSRPAATRGAWCSRSPIRASRARDARSRVDRARLAEPACPARGTLRPQGTLTIADNAPTCTSVRIALPMPDATDRMPLPPDRDRSRRRAPAREYLKARLTALWPELVIAGIAANGPDAQALLGAKRPTSRSSTSGCPASPDSKSRAVPRWRATRVRDGVRPVTRWMPSSGRRSTTC